MNIEFEEFDAEISAFEPETYNLTWQRLAPEEEGQGVNAPIAVERVGTSEIAFDATLLLSDAKDTDVFRLLFQLPCGTSRREFELWVTYDELKKDRCEMRVDNLKPLNSKLALLMSVLEFKSESTMPGFVRLAGQNDFPPEDLIDPLDPRFFYPVFEIQKKDIGRVTNWGDWTLATRHYGSPEEEENQAPGRPTGEARSNDLSERMVHVEDLQNFTLIPLEGSDQRTYLGIVFDFSKKTDVTRFSELNERIRQGGCYLRLKFKAPDASKTSREEDGPTGYYYRADNGSFLVPLMLNDQNFFLQRYTLRHGSDTFLLFLNIDEAPDKTPFKETHSFTVGRHTNLDDRAKAQEELTKFSVAKDPDWNRGYALKNDNYEIEERDQEPLVEEVEGKNAWRLSKIIEFGDDSESVRPIKIPIHHVLYSRPKYDNVLAIDLGSVHTLVGFRSKAGGSARYERTLLASIPHSGASSSEHCTDPFVDGSGKAGLHTQNRKDELELSRLLEGLNDDIRHASNEDFLRSSEHLHLQYFDLKNAFFFGRDHDFREAEGILRKSLKHAIVVCFQTRWKNEIKAKDMGKQPLQVIVSQPMHASRSRSRRFQEILKDVILDYQCEYIGTFDRDEARKKEILPCISVSEPKAVAVAGLGELCPQEGGQCLGIDIGNRTIDVAIVEHSPREKTQTPTDEYIVRYSVSIPFGGQMVDFMIMHGVAEILQRGLPEETSGLRQTDFDYLFPWNDHRLRHFADPYEGSCELTPSVTNEVEVKRLRRYIRHLFQMAKHDPDMFRLEVRNEEEGAPQIFSRGFCEQLARRFPEGGDGGVALRSSGQEQTLEISWDVLTKTKALEVGLKTVETLLKPAFEESDNCDNLYVLGRASQFRPLTEIVSRLARDNGFTEMAGVPFAKGADSVKSREALINGMLCLTDNLDSVRNDYEQTGYALSVGPNYEIAAVCPVDFEREGEIALESNQSLILMEGPPCDEDFLRELCLAEMGLEQSILQAIFPLAMDDRHTEFKFSEFRLNGENKAKLRRVANKITVHLERSETGQAHQGSHEIRDTGIDLNML